MSAIFLENYKILKGSLSHKYIIEIANSMLVGVAFKVFNERFKKEPFEKVKEDLLTALVVAVQSSHKNIIISIDDRIIKCGKGNKFQLEAI